MPKPADRKTIAVDIDDVLSDHVAAFVKFSNQKWGTNLTPDDYDEDWATIWKIDQAELERRSAEIHTSNLISTYKHLPESDAAIRQLAKSYKLVIITSRRKWVSEETAAWVEKYYKGLFEEIHFAGIWDDVATHSSHKVKLTKGEVAKEIGADYLIDDQPKHCIAAAQAGIKAVLFGDYAWNHDAELVPGVIRAKTWQEVLEYFDAAR